MVLSPVQEFLPGFEAPGSSHQGRPEAWSVSTFSSPSRKRAEGSIRESKGMACGRAPSHRRRSLKPFPRAECCQSCRRSAGTSTAPHLQQPARATRACPGAKPGTASPRVSGSQRGTVGGRGPMRPTSCAAAVTSSSPRQVCCLSARQATRAIAAAPSKPAAAALE